MPKTLPYAAFAHRLFVAVKKYELRSGKQVRQKALAKRLGYSAANVNNWFKGQAMPSVEQLEALGRELDTSPAYLAFGDFSEVYGPDGEPLVSPSPAEPGHHQQGQRGGK